MSTIEDRLRDAMAARARTVPDDGLDHLRPAPRAARRRGAGTAAVAAAVAVAATAFTVVRLAHPSPAPSTSGVGVTSASPTLQVSIYLCGDTSPYRGCRKGAATEREKERVRQVMAARPDVAGVEFEDRRKAFENFRRSETNPRLLKVVTVEDMPESFRVRLTPGADHAAVARAASRLPGVSNVIDEACIRDGFARLGSGDGVVDGCDFNGGG
ncbi:permease-like cell division protein FtsX [Microbispora amethystogenes]|uniref:FtsX extracellular domain-containing protein n=1 Tax=Microbispora amethystogenes TaxID=1427754 RepID=A0ABQ4FP25_9ACTN|nr:permease-like cell division protein FtsX [Microbispora amethystogenes]GIH36547.1 hypothetical protein Mam01_67110 [Microbispora amethystogenes]